MIYTLTVPPLCVAALALTLLSGGVSRDRLKASYRHLEAGGTVEFYGCTAGNGHGEVDLNSKMLQAIYPWRYDGKWPALVEKLGQLAQGYCAEVSLNPRDDTLLVCVGSSTEVAP